MAADRDESSNGDASANCGSQPVSPSGEDDWFIELLTKNQLRLRSYVFALVRQESTVDDVLQEASVALWKLRRQFDRSRDFFRWACGIALIEVLRYRRKRAADKLLFDEAILNSLAADYLEYWDGWDQRRDALRSCLKKLDEKDRLLLNARYHSDATTAEIARQMARPLSTIYSSLSRIREALYQCVERTLAQHSRG